MIRQMLSDLRDAFAWAKSNRSRFLSYMSDMGLMLFNTAVVLSVPFSPALIAQWLWPEWGGVALVANVAALAVLAWAVNAYERSRR